MFAVVTPDTIHLPPGAVVRLLGSWRLRIKYFNFAE